MKNFIEKIKINKGDMAVILPFLLWIGIMLFTFLIKEGIL